MPEREWSRPTAPTSQFPSFDQLDANRDGVITREEWSAGFGKAPPVDEQERLERNLAALAATVTAPATRRSPDYTSATFETFERGAFSDTFERGTVALPPSGAAATALHDLRAQRDESLKLHGELQEVRGALEAERSITKRLTAQLHTTAARQAQASADRTAEEGAIQRAADSRQLAEQGAADAMRARDDALVRLAAAQQALAAKDAEHDEALAAARTEKNAALAAATREREAALATARLEREGALVAAQQRVDELLKVVETQEGAHAREATALRAHGERLRVENEGLRTQISTLREHGDPATLRAELAGARAAQQQAHHAALAAESKAADAIANERGLILAGGDQAALRARAEAAEERAAASEATVAHLRTEVAAARAGGGGYGGGGGGGGEAVNAAERRAAAAEARASHAEAQLTAALRQARDNQAAAGLSAPSPSFGISGFGAGGGELGREAAAEDLQAFASKLSVAARAARPWPPPGHDHVAGEPPRAMEAYPPKISVVAAPGQFGGAGVAWDSAAAAAAQAGAAARAEVEERLASRHSDAAEAEAAALRRRLAETERALSLERQEAEGLRAEAARYRAAEYSEDNTAATAAARRGDAQLGHLRRELEAAQRGGDEARRQRDALRGKLEQTSRALEQAQANGGRMVVAASDGGAIGGDEARRLAEEKKRWREEAAEVMADQAARLEARVAAEEQRLRAKFERELAAATRDAERRAAEAHAAAKARDGARGNLRGGNSEELARLRADNLKLREQLRETERAAERRAAESYAAKMARSGGGPPSPAARPPSGGMRGRFVRRLS